jgi:hypothetical protein
MDSIKKCVACGQVKPVEEFYANGWRNGRLRRKSRCKSCLKPGLLKAFSERHRLYRRQALEHYGGVPPRCSCCAEARVEFLTIDHAAGGGTRHRREELQNSIGHGIYGWLRRQGYPRGFRVLCMNCNSALGWYGYCPHELERQGSLSQGELAGSSPSPTPARR